MQTMAAHAVTSRVPATSGSTPKDAGSNKGDQSVPVRKSAIEISPKNSNAGTKSATTIPTVVATDTKAQRARTTLTTSSPQRLREARSRSGSGAAVSRVATPALRLS
jgi:hypothetical protein